METIKTTKFMDNTLSFRQMLPLSRETITILNLLVIMMRGRSEKYPTRQAWSQAINHAYAAKIMTGMTGYGNQVLLDTRLKYLRPEYIEDPKYPDKILDLSNQALNHPVLTQENLDEAKYLLRNRLISARENPDVLAVQTALKIAEPGHAVGIPVGGILEDIDGVTLEDVKKIWETIRQTPYKVIGVGDFEEKMEQFLDSIPQDETMKLEMTMLTAHEPAYSVQTKDLSQSSLAQVYATGIQPGSQESYALVLMNAILGASPMSLLFEEIREKHSYCYSISSSLIRYDGAVMILTGTRRENMNDVIRLIAEQIEVLRQNAFPQEKMEAAKLALVDGLVSQQDVDLAMINQLFINRLLRRDFSVEELIERVQSITREQVAQVARKMHLIAQAQVLEEEDPKGEDQQEAPQEERK